jgi:hypothetical protein
MEDSITLRRSEQRRVHVLMQLAGGVVSTGQAAELLSLSERQVRRLSAALASEGPAGTDPRQCLSLNRRAVRVRRP